MNNLTNDAKFLLSSMYAKYIERRKDGSSRISKKKSCLNGLLKIHDLLVSNYENMVI